jgi:hypothetical protein
MPSLVGESLPRVVQALLVASTVPGSTGKYFTLHGCDSAELRPAFDALLGLGMVHCRRSGFFNSEWSFTERGAASMSIKQTLHEPRRARVPRDGVPRSELTAVEHISLLQVVCWEARTWTPVREGPNALSPYISDTGTQVWWVRVGAKSVSAPYLLALFMAVEHKPQFEHFQTDVYYHSWLTDAPLAPNALRRQRVTFDFMDTDLLALPDRPPEVRGSRR